MMSVSFHCQGCELSRLLAHVHFFSKRHASLNVLGDGAVLCALPGSHHLPLPVMQIYTAGVL